jgi:hypothetical protein
MKIAIVGCVANYGVTEITPYVNSIAASGFVGQKVMIVYNVPYTTIEFLKKKGWDVYESTPQHHVIIQRFMDIAELASHIDADVIISTDVKDVVFQVDPTEWITTKMTSPIIATSECILFKDEEWAVVNAGTSFPSEWSWLQNHESYCAGIIIGQREYVRDLFKDIYRWALTGNNPAQLADQAAFNILIRMKQFESIVQFVKQDEGLAVHMGVPWMKRVSHHTKITSPIPSIMNDGTVITTDATPFAIVHQYDRDNRLRQAIHKKYEL